MVGFWQPQYEVIGQVANQLRHGTTRTSSFSITDEWSRSVTSSVEAGFEVKGAGSLESKVETTVSRSYANTYKQEWQVTEEEVFTITLGGIGSNVDQGRTLWQWIFEITDPLGDVYFSKSRRYALTDGQEIPPRCQPGYAAGTSLDYQECTSPDRILPGFEGALPVLPDSEMLFINRYELFGNLDVGGSYYNDPKGDALIDGFPGAQQPGEIVAWLYPSGPEDSDPVEVGQVKFYLEDAAVITEMKINFVTNYCFGLDSPKFVEVSINGKSFVLDTPDAQTGTHTAVLDLVGEEIEPTSEVYLGIFSRSFPGAPRFTPGRCGYPGTTGKVGISEVVLTGYVL